MVAVNFPAPTAQQLGARHRQVRAGGEWRGDNNVSVVFQGRVASCKPQIPLTSSGESVTTDSGRRGCGGGRLFLNDFFRASFHRLFACACVHACSETRSSPLLGQGPFEDLPKATGPPAPGQLHGTLRLREFTELP